jgi:hypothetical protein
LASGLGTAEDKSDHLQALKEMVRGVMRSHYPIEKSSRESA